MIHLTIQTGHTARIQEPCKQAVDALRPLLADGGGDIGDIIPFMRGLKLTMCKRPWNGAVSWDINRAGAPIALCVVCGYADAQESAWRVIERNYLSLSDERPDLYAPGAAPSMPGELPWLVTLLLPGVHAHLDVLDFLADMNQCIAYTAMRMVCGG